jgi:hypothetical protein
MSQPPNKFQIIRVLSGQVAVLALRFSRLAGLGVAAFRPHFGEACNLYAGDDRFDR